MPVSFSFVFIFLCALSSFVIYLLCASLSLSNFWPGFVWLFVAFFWSVFFSLSVFLVSHCLFLSVYCFVLFQASIVFLFCFISFIFFGGGASRLPQVSRGILEPQCLSLKCSAKRQNLVMFFVLSLLSVYLSICLFLSVFFLILFCFSVCLFACLDCLGVLISLSVSLFCLFSFVFPCSIGCSLSISLYAEVLALLSLFVFCGAGLERFVFVNICSSSSCCFLYFSLMCLC